jgi:hypothetical protein
MVLDFLVQLSYLCSWCVYPSFLMFQNDRVIAGKQSPEGYFRKGRMTDTKNHKRRRVDMTRHLTETEQHKKELPWKLVGFFLNLCLLVQGMRC